MKRSADSAELERGHVAKRQQIMRHTEYPAHTIVSGGWVGITVPGFSARLADAGAAFCFAESDYDCSVAPGFISAAPRPCKLIFMSALRFVLTYFVSNCGLVFVRFRKPDVVARSIDGGEPKPDPRPHMLSWTLAPSVVVVLNDTSGIVVNAVLGRSDDSVLVYELIEDPISAAGEPKCPAARCLGAVPRAWADAHAADANVRNYIRTDQCLVPSCRAPACCEHVISHCPKDCAHGREHDAGPTWEPDVAVVGAVVNNACVLSTDAAKLDP
jgi:hypothetical protein